MTDENFTSRDTPATGPGQGMLSFLLPEIMTIETAERLTAQLAALPLAQKSGLTLDASQVENITTPGIQIILSLRKTMSIQGGTIRLERMPPLFVQAFADTGLEDLIH